MQVGLREANQRFAKLVKRARKGEEIVLTDRGKPVARITGIPENGKDDWEAALDRMAAMGLLRRATKRGPMPPFKPFPATSESTTVTLRKMRDEG